MCGLSAALVSAFSGKNKKGDAAISAADEKNKKEDAGLANIGNGLIAPRSQLGFGTVPRSESFLTRHLDPRLQSLPSTIPAVMPIAASPTALASTLPGVRTDILG